MVRSHLMPLVIAGPTAGGKSSLALMLAQKHRGEIICADSRQFYSHMAIGTACPSAHDLSLARHHGYGIIDPKEQKIDAGFFINFALNTIAEVQSRHKRPILVGGTGLYLRALYYGLDDVPKTDPQVAQALAIRFDNAGLDAMYQELCLIDKDGASSIKPQDRYRILRALEIFYVTKKAPSALRASFKSNKPKLLARWLYKKPDKASLLVNIENRVKDMFAQGLLDEARKLASHLPPDHWALKVMGYEEALMFLNKEITFEQTLEKTIIRHRQYAKRQYTWFNKEPFYRLIF